MSDLLTKAEIEDPEIPLDDEPEIPLEDEDEAPEGSTAVTPALAGGDTATAAPTQDGTSALAPRGLVEVLPADFPLPSLIHFVPDTRLKAALDQAASHALTVKVDGTEGLQVADRALTAVRTSLKAIEEEFREPTAIADRLHKRLTGMRGEWCEPGKAALDTVGRRMALEQRRLDQIAAEARRKAQEEADRKAREEARREAEAAAKAQAPAPVVEQLQRQAETATAPPVHRPEPVKAALKDSTPTSTWKARIAGTPADAEPNPKMADLTPAQRQQVFTALHAVLDGKAPLSLFEINWSTANGRAKSDKSTFQIPGFEAWEDLGIRAKGGRRKA